MKDKLKEFYIITKLLNQENITPILYGSLGLNYEIKTNYNADDIDILIAEEYLENKWEQLKNTIESKTTYKLIDLKEHTFFDGTNKISLAKFGNLGEILKIDTNNLRTEFYKGTKFLSLNAKQFLLVYEFTSNDEYRKKIGKNIADEQKVHRIKEYLIKQKLEIEACQFLPATINDYLQIRKLYSNVIKSTLTTWDKDYPSSKLIKENIKNGELFVLKNSEKKVLGVTFVSSKFETDTWKLKLQNPYRFARICTDPKKQGLSVGTKMMKEIIAYVKSLKSDGLQIHVYKQNAAAIKLYENFNFVKTGEKQEYGYDYYKFELKF